MVVVAVEDYYKWMQIKREKILEIRFIMIIIIGILFDGSDFV